MRHFLVFVLLFATPASFSKLARADDIADCQQRQNSQRRISACTRLLKPEQLDAEKRATIHINRGSAFGLMRQLDKAFADFDLAIKLNPAYIRAYYTRGWAYYKTGRLDKAIADFNRVIELNPKYARAS